MVVSAYLSNKNKLIKEREGLRLAVKGNPPVIIYHPVADPLEKVLYQDTPYMKRLLNLFLTKQMLVAYSNSWLFASKTK